MTRTKIGIAACAVAGLLGATPALADTILFSGDVAASTEGTGSSYTGSLDVTGSTLTITLDVFGPVGGYLTGIAFNGPAGAISGQMSAPTASFELSSPDGASPFGDFTCSSALGGSWLGGGSPNNGVAVDDVGNATWTFSLDAATYSASDFWVESCGGPDNCATFVARFRGLDDGGGDKVPAIPEPETYALMLAGLAAVAALARRRRAA